MTTDTASLLLEFDVLKADGTTSEKITTRTVYSFSTPGSDATSYWLISDAEVIGLNEAGTDYTPTILTLTAKEKTGTNDSIFYEGRFEISESLNGSS
jgi:hypothetical protein